MYIYLFLKSIASCLRWTAIKLLVILILVSTSSITSAEVQGCTNPLANNYDSSATQDDGSCLINGCTDPYALNYDSSATQDDYSCDYGPGWGGGWDNYCDNPEASNHGQTGSCVINGCTNPESISYNPNATPGNPMASDCVFPKKVTFQVDMSGSSDYSAPWLWLPNHGDYFDRDGLEMTPKGINFPNIYIAEPYLYQGIYSYRFSLQNPEQTLDSLESPVGLIAGGCANEDNNRMISVNEAGYSTLHQGYHSYDDTELPIVAYGSCTDEPYVAPTTVSVTFQVDMSAVDTNTDGVYIAGGSVFGQDGVLLTNDGTDIWSATVELDMNTQVLYKFRNQPSYGTWDGFEDPAGLIAGECNTGPYNDRFVDVAEADIVLDTVAYGSCTINPYIPPPPPPIPAAPVPTDAADSVLSVFSSTYGNLAGTDFNPNWGQSTSVNAGDNLAYTNLNYQGTAFANQDVSGYEYLNVDYYVTESTAVNFFLIGDGGETSVALDVSATEQWVNVQIPLTSYSSFVNLADVFQFKVDGNGSVAFNNIYFGGVADVPGCIDEVADNYNPAATSDDGSCLYTVSVTFQVDMNAVDTNADGVYLAGGFVFGQDGFLMTNNGSDVWTATVDFDMNTQVLYKFRNQPSYGTWDGFEDAAGLVAGGCNAGTYDDRFVDVGESDIVLDITPYGECYYEQSISVSNSPKGILGKPVVFEVSYDTNANNNQLSGLGLRVHFDSSILSYSQITNLIEQDIIVSGQGPFNDGDDFDNDPLTDQYILFGWASLYNNWPNVELPAVLMNIAFDVLTGINTDELATTSINFTETALAADHQFGANNYDLELVSLTWDFDGNGVADALTDGLMLLRYHFGLRGEYVTENAVALDSPLSSEEVIAEMEAAFEIADIDDDAEIGALTDGLMLLRYLFGLRGDALTTGVVSLKANRSSNEEIEAYFEAYMP